MHKFVAFMGIIGSGKTTAANLLKTCRFVPHEEDFNHNPFLSKYYKNMKRWAFHSQMYFLVHKVKQNLNLCTDLKHHNISEDFPLYQDLAFAKTCHHLGFMTNAEWDLYYETFLLLNGGFKNPDLLVYLKVKPSVALKRIKNRGREYEQEIPGSYLVSLQTSIEDLIKENPTKSKIITIDANRINLVSNVVDQQSFIKQIVE